VRTEELKSRQIMTGAKVHRSPDVTLEDVRVAVFQNEADRIIFKRLFLTLSVRTSLCVPMGSEQ
jgi:hypothetical protein